MKLVCLMLLAACSGPRLGATINREVSYPAPLPDVSIVVKAKAGSAMQWDAQNDISRPELTPFDEHTPVEKIIGNALKEELENRGFAVRTNASVLIECNVDNLMHTRRIYGYGWYGSHNHFAALDMRCTIVDGGKTVWSGFARGRWYHEGSADGDKQDVHGTIGRATQIAATQFISQLCLAPRGEDIAQGQRLLALDADHSRVHGLLKLALAGPACDKQPPRAVDPAVIAALQDKEPRVRAAAVLALATLGDNERLKQLAMKIYDEKHIVQWAIIAGFQMRELTGDFTRALNTLGPDARFQLSPSYGR